MYAGKCVGLVYPEPRRAAAFTAMCDINKLHRRADHRSIASTTFPVSAFTRQVDAATLARLIYTPTIAVLDCCS